MNRDLIGYMIRRGTNYRILSNDGGPMLVEEIHAWSIKQLYDMQGAWNHDWISINDYDKKFRDIERPEEQKSNDDGGNDDE